MKLRGSYSYYSQLAIVNARGCMGVRNKESSWSGKILYNIEYVDPLALGASGRQLVPLLQLVNLTVFLGVTLIDWE